MAKELPVRICGDTTKLDRYLSDYMTEKETADVAEQAKKEASMSVLQIHSDAGTFQTAEHQFTVVAEFTTDTVSLADIKKECPEIAELLASMGLVKKRVTKTHITAVKKL